jgi:hypothetical protein
VHRINHGLENREEMVVGVFRVLARDHVRRTDDVGKQHRNNLAFAIKARQ